MSAPSFSACPAVKNGAATGRPKPQATPRAAGSRGNPPRRMVWGGDGVDGVGYCADGVGSGADPPGRMSAGTRRTGGAATQGDRRGRRAQRAAFARRSGTSRMTGKRRHDLGWVLPGVGYCADGVGSGVDGVGSGADGVGSGADGIVYTSLRPQEVCTRHPE